MSFTKFYKSCCGFGINDANSPSLSHTDEVKDTSGQTFYFNSKFPFFYRGVAACDIGTNWDSFTDVFNGETGAYSGTKTAMSTVSRSVTENEDGVIVRFTVTNNTSDPVIIKAIAHYGTTYLYNTTSATTNTVSRSVYYIYANLSEPIEIPANDSVFLDVTFSAGDISDVSVG